MKYLLFKQLTYFDGYYDQEEVTIDMVQINGIYNETELKEVVLKDIDEELKEDLDIIAFCDCDYNGDNDYRGNHYSYDNFNFSNDDLNFLNKFKNEHKDDFEELLNKTDMPSEEITNIYCQIRYDLHHTEFENISNIKRYKKTVYFSYSAPGWRDSYDLTYYVIRIR